MRIHRIASVGAGFDGVFHAAPRPASVSDIGCGPPSRRQRIWLDVLTTGYDVHPYEGVLPLDLSRPLEEQRADVSADVITLLDVLEHLSTVDGWARIRELRTRARLGLVVATPYGWVPQDDTPQLAEDHATRNPYQTHRSGWWPADLRRLGASELWAVEPKSHAESAWARGGWQIAWIPTTPASV